ncbi:glycosyltransferase family 39 protein [Waterburya agarophytonicola K14]|uniref:Glycosyltransferase family 39 protein n=1 Tax=Waterburya agarophytonicola KI4 TaxID=2874699 RepID=A0A964FIE7_9CYAN|nr:glycosyltransferase family 39 protein [Waterburya agarophytonicola KI4]
MRENRQFSWQQGLIILGLIWLFGAVCDRFWYSLDNSVPAWDQADYLNGVLNYAEALQTSQWLSGEWWRSFWLLSNKIPPLNYILTAPLVNLFGTTEDVATLIMLFYSAVLLVSVYGLGVVLFDVNTGLWAAGLCQLIPGLYYYRLEFILDYPLTTAVIFSFWLLTLYFFNQNKLNGWILGILWGISFGLAMLMKQTALFFLFFPLLWVFLSVLKKRQWLRLLQLISSLLVGIAVAFPWYRTNWLLILTSGKRATVDSAIAEGDPALNTLNAWTYYGKILPYLLSWHLLIIPSVGLLIYLIRKYIYRRSNTKNLIYANKKAWISIAVFLLGGYFLSSLNINKDARYILPLLPVLSLILAVGLLSWRDRGRKYILWITASLGIILILLNIFPVGGEAIASKLNPRTQRYPYTGKSYPHPEVIAEIQNISPYLRTVLGILPSTLQINQHNFSFYGKQNNARISGRQVGVRKSEILPDSRSLDWFITKTGEQGSIPESQPAIVKLVEQGKDFKLQKTWQLPDDSWLKLYHRDRPAVEVVPITLSPSLPITLSPYLPITQSLPGVPIPVTYQWQGDRHTLESGMVLLTWEHEDNPNSFWIHDLAIGMGALNFSHTVEDGEFFQVIARTAMLPPGNIQPGKYNLQGVYLDRHTGNTQPIDLSSTSIIIDPQAAPITAPELDLVTQLRNTAPKMAENIQGLEPIFAQTARINQYDAQQDYLKQAELSLSYRLKHQQVSPPQQKDWLYAIALSQVLQQDVNGAISSFKQITNLYPQNPYGYAYLAFVYLYDWQPRLAEVALNSAIEINPNIPELTTLQGAAAVMQGRLIKAWKLFNY